MEELIVCHTRSTLPKAFKYSLHGALKVFKGLHEALKKPFIGLRILPLDLQKAFIMRFEGTSFPYSHLWPYPLLIPTACPFSPLLLFGCFGNPSTPDMPLSWHISTVSDACSSPHNAPSANDNGHRLQRPMPAAFEQLLRSGQTL